MGVTRHPMIALALVAAVVASAACTGTEPDSGDGSASATTSAEATGALFSEVDPEGPGWSVAVGRDGRVVFAEAIGRADVSTGAPLTPETVVDIGSVAKQFTATAVLLLAQRGELDLQAPVARYLDGLPAWAGEVTVEQLMHHTSGVPDYIDLLLDEGVDTTEPADTAAALAVLRSVGLDFAPGRRFAYSNSNYLLLAEIVASVDGTSLPAVLEREIFAPLGLSATMDPGDVPGKARSYALEGGEWVVDDSPWTQVGDGAVQTTPSELVRWASQYWDPTIGGPSLQTARLAGAVRDPAGGRYGAGIVEGEDPELGRVLGHGGGWEGFATDFAVLPEDRLAVAVTCNADALAPIAEGAAVTILDAWR